MYPKILSKVEVWELENIIFKLYGVIRSFKEEIEFCENGQHSEDFEKKCTEFNLAILQFFENPLDYGFCRKSDICLTLSQLVLLRNTIIETENLQLALDFVTPRLCLHTLIEAVIKNCHTELTECRSYIFLVALKNFRKELWQWVRMHTRYTGVDLKDVLVKHGEDPFTISQKIFDGKQDRVTAVRRKNAMQNEIHISGIDLLATLFIPKIERHIIAKIYQRISRLASEKRSMYISKIVSLIVFAHYNKLLRCSYAKAVKTLLLHLGMRVRECYLHPAIYGHLTIKGRARASYCEAEEFFSQMNIPGSQRKVNQKLTKS
jgi:hypothetical protein